MNDRSTLLLEHHLKELKLPSFLREYGKMAAQYAAEGVDHPEYLLRLAELELIDRHQRMVERRIRAARFPAVKSLDTFDFTAIPSVNKSLVMELARCEYIQRRENIIAVSNSGMDSPRHRRPPRHRVRRKRMAQEGMLLQIDGSRHRWLGEQGPRFVLLLAVDDATGTVPDALFSQEEDTRGYFLLMEGLIRQCGIPLAVYSDRHAVFKHTGEVGRKPAGPTQFARAMEELGIRQIFARSPQAKGRVERTAGTFQDRLVTELRLAGVTTIDEANEVLHRFLPRFNEKFGVPAEHSSVAYRSMESSVSLDQILCFKHRRKVARDNTVKYNWRTLQLLPGKERPSYAGAQLEVHEGLDGQLLVQYRGRTIPTQEAPPRPGVLRTSNGALPYGPGLERRVNGVGSHPKESLAYLDAIEADSATLNGGGRVRKPPASPRRKPTPRQRVRWKAVQQAKLRGLSIRGIARSWASTGTRSASTPKPRARP